MNGKPGRNRMTATAKRHDRTDTMDRMDGMDRMDRMTARR